MNQLVIFGAGGHAREAAQLVANINQAYPGRWQLAGFLCDPQAANRNQKPLPAPLLGDIQWLMLHPEVQVVVAVGDTKGRRHIVQRLRQALPALRFATLIHPGAWLSEQTRLGEGSLVFAGSLINTDVAIGSHASINLGCTISHDCVLGDFVNLGPGVHLGGAVTLGDEVDIGIGAVCKPGIQVGQQVVVGAGAVVVHPVAIGQTVAGVPARALRRTR